MPPPATVGFESRTPMTTRFGEMRSMRFAQAGVWPTWLQGSRVTYHVLSASNGWSAGETDWYASTSAWA